MSFTKESHQRWNDGRSVAYDLQSTSSHANDLIVSDPSHERYGQHLLAEEVNTIIAPSDTALDLVHQWLEEHGISKSQLSYSPAKDWIKVKLSIADIEDLLQTEYSTFEDEDGNVVYRAPEWSLPLYLHDYIATI
jgi:tripeptidyl-peptidase I